jgi:hypothetical protein
MSLRSTAQLGMLTNTIFIVVFQLCAIVIGLSVSSLTASSQSARFR